MNVTGLYYYYYFKFCFLYLKAGKFTYVKDTENLRKDLATYYDFFSTKTVRDEPIISIPYIDAFGTGKKAIYNSFFLYIAIKLL